MKSTLMDTVLNIQMKYIQWTHRTTRATLQGIECSLLEAITLAGAFNQKVVLQTDGTMSCLKVTIVVLEQWFSNSQAPESPERSLQLTFPQINPFRMSRSQPWGMQEPQESTMGRNHGNPFFAALPVPELPAG